MAYSELVKNFEKIREYMRGFYVYGFKNRNEYTQKSARSYDDERRRIESWLGGHMRFSLTPDGKNVFISIDSRAYRHNPLYTAWKAKSFTDGDITLHFMVFDILWSPDIKLSLNEILEQLDNYIIEANSGISFDESTVRKKLKEYCELGLIIAEKQGNKTIYSRCSDTDISILSDILDFFSEAAPVGVIGSFLLDKHPYHDNIFSFKHHYITESMDSNVLACIFDAMSERRFITAENHSPRAEGAEMIKVVPLKVFISVQSGRQNLIAFEAESKHFVSFRLDRLSNVKKDEFCNGFDSLRSKLNKNEQHIWGVNCRFSSSRLEHIEFDVNVNDDEQHIVNRLNREKRGGTVEQIDEHTYKFSADVFDATEVIPWIRTFICRIKRFSCSNRTVENTFKADLEEMYKMYGISGGNGNDIQ